MPGTGTGSSFRRELGTGCCQAPTGATLFRRPHPLIWTVGSGDQGQEVLSSRPHRVLAVASRGEKPSQSRGQIPLEGVPPADRSFASAQRCPPSRPSPPLTSAPRPVTMRIRHFRATGSHRPSPLRYSPSLWFARKEALCWVVRGWENTIASSAMRNLEPKVTGKVRGGKEAREEARGERRRESGRRRARTGGTGFGSLPPSRDPDRTLPQTS